MTYANGKLPADALTSIGGGEKLSDSTAHAYFALVADGAAHGQKVRPAAGVGSGYRSLAVQELYWDGAHGNRAAAAKVGLNPDSHISVAAPGGSSHGTGTRIDLLFNGSSSPNAAQIALAKKYGFTREFGASDPNHFEHDGKTAISAARKSTRVEANQTLSGIAAAHHLTLPQLERLNPQITHPSQIAIGQKVWLS